MTAKDTSDAIISMDADLQDDINAIDKMILKFLDGVDIVYGVRFERKRDTFFKRFTAESFYKILRFFSDNPKHIIYNHADYRLMSRRALEGLAEYMEVNLYLRGIIPAIGYRQETVYYSRNERIAGTSKYPLKKMLAFAAQGITSLSIKPMRIISVLGFFIFLSSIGMLIYFFDTSLYRQNDCRMVVSRRFNLGNRRTYPNVDRCTRRIYRKDLFRNQTPPTLHHRSRY